MQLLFLLPCLTSALITKYDPIQINSASIIYQKYYMFDKKSTPASNNIGNGQSFIELNFEVKKNIPDLHSRGTIEAYIATEEFFNHIGYVNNGAKIACCDESSYGKQCNHLNHLVVPPGMEQSYVKVEKTMDGNPLNITMHYDVPVEGKYYMILAMCDPTTANFNITGNTMVMNPYGHIPARLYGTLPFTRVLLNVYVILVIVWAFRCIRFSNQLMSVHYVISIVLVTFLVDVVVKWRNLNAYNSTGTYVTSITVISLFVSAVTRAIARCLTLMIAMGLGISRASLGKTSIRVVLMGVIYFVFSFWDAVSSTFATSSDLKLWRIIPTSLVDSVFYFWILQSLLDTINSLEDQKQTSKLNVFLKLRNIIVAVVVLSTIYNIGFSYMVATKLIESQWKYQWFFNDGIWSLFYCLIIVVIMYLWAPDERSLAYAYHVQVSTDERPDVEATPEQDTELQPVIPNEQVTVETLNSEETMKPMTM